jgi:HCOMODA/2-hydroxy-3-carboxy-muconic semialdehyde decarboxylase
MRRPDNDTSASATQWDRLAEVVAASQILSGLGLLEAFGHVSARESETDFIITPRKSLASVSEDELLRIRIVAGAALEVVSGDPEAVPVEAVIHGAVYAARSDVRAICRDHPEATSVLAAGGVAIRPVHALGAAGGGATPVYDTPDLVTDWSAGRSLAETLGAASAVVLRGNGRIVVGSSVPESCARAVLLEESARIQLAALCAGLTPRYLTESEIENAVRDIASPRQIVRVWEHYCAKHCAASRPRRDSVIMPTQK